MTGLGGGASGQWHRGARLSLRDHTLHSKCDRMRRACVRSGMTYVDVVARSEHKDYMMLGASGHGTSNAFGPGLDALDALCK